jgi:hypothetical protein
MCFVDVKSQVDTTFYLAKNFVVEHDDHISPYR